MAKETPNHEIRPPKALAVLGILGRLAIQRWINRWNHLLRVFLPKATRNAGTVSSKPRRGFMQILFASILAAVLLLNGFFLANTALVFPADEVAVQTDHLGKELVEHATYMGYAEAQRHILEAGGSPNEAETRARWLNFAHQVSVLESTQRILTDQAQAALTNQLYAKFQAYGVSGFAYRHSGLLALSEQVWPTSPTGRVLYAQVLGFTFCLVPVILVLLHLGVTNREIGQVDWSFEWLFTFPVPARTLFLSRTCVWITNPTLWIFVFPYTWLIFVAGGARWWSPVFGLFATLYTGWLAGSISVLAEVLLRKSLSLARLKNLQALCTVLGGICLLLYLTLSASRPVSELLIHLIGGVQFPLYALPTSLPVAMAMPGANVQQFLLSILAMLLIGSGLPVLTSLLCDQLTRDGLLQSSSSQKTTVSNRSRNLSKTIRGPLIRERAILGKLIGSGVWITEFHLLCRDRNLLTQALIFPLIIVAYYLLSHVSVVAAAAGFFTHAAALTYGISAFILLNGAFPLLAREHKTMWLLVSLPMDLTRILRDKAVGWAIFASVYSLFFMGLLALLQQHLTWGALLDAATVLVGVCICSFLAVGLGTLATDVSGQESKMRPDLVYFYIFLATLFIGAIYAHTFTLEAAQILLTLAVTGSLWQRVKAKAPFILDPEAQPEIRSDLLSALAPILILFVARNALLAAFNHGLEMPVASPATQLWASLGAGGLVCWGSLVGRRLKNVKSEPFDWKFSGRKIANLAISMFVCVGSVLVAGAYFYKVGPPAFVDSNHTSNGSIIPTAPAFLRCNQLGCLLPWFLFGGPVIQGYLYRTLLLQELLKVTKPGMAIGLQALVYVMVQTQDYRMAAPIFVLGLSTGMTWFLTRNSAIPVLAQIVFNAIMIWRFGVTAGV